MTDNQLREILKLFNMRALSKKAGIGYSTLKNFSSGYKESLSANQRELLVNTINSIKI